MVGCMALSIAQSVALSVAQIVTYSDWSFMGHNFRCINLIEVNCFFLTRNINFFFYL